MSDRAEFESTVRATWSDSYSFMRDTDGHYCDDALDGMWWAWQAARAESGQGAEPVATVESIDPMNCSAVVRWNPAQNGVIPKEIDRIGTKLYTQPQPAQPEGGGWIKCSETQRDAINHALDVLSKNGDAFTSVGAMRVLDAMLSEIPKEGYGDE